MKAILANQNALKESIKSFSPRGAVTPQPIPSHSILDKTKPQSLGHALKDLKKPPEE